MKKTKIICTMGPAVKDEETLRGLIRGGMDVARFNFSHGTHEEQKGRMDLLKKIRAEEKVPVAILLDTKVPLNHLVKWSNGTFGRFRQLESAAGREKKGGLYLVHDNQSIMNEQKIA